MRSGSAWVNIRAAAVAMPVGYEIILARDKVVAVGEMGLDYFYEKDTALQAKQRECFAQQLAIAEEAQLPVIIHTREAQSDTLDSDPPLPQSARRDALLYRELGDGRGRVGVGLLHFNLGDCYVRQR